MDKMKKQLGNRCRLLSVVLLLIVALQAYVALGPGFPVSENVNEHILAFQQGLLAGASIALMALVAYHSIALRNEAKLKKMYYQMKDERMAAVRMKSGAPSLMICAICLFAASFAAMYFNTTVSITLIASAIFALLLGVVRKGYYHARLSAADSEE